MVSAAEGGIARTAPRRAAAPTRHALPEIAVHIRLSLALLMLGCLSAVWAQQAATPASPSPPVPPAAATGGATAPAAADRTPIVAKVIEVQGDVQQSPLEPEAWKPVQTGDVLSEQTQIRTGIRSAVKLQIGEEEPYTAMIIESVGKTILSEAYKTRDTKRVRVGVGYGRVRAGVAEGGLQSDFTVDSPVATLSKKGTWNFGMFYERGTDRFEIFLLDYGLVDALSKSSNEIRRLNPGEAVTQAMRRWLDESQRRSNVSIQDAIGQGTMDVAFNRLSNDGLRVTNPEGGGATLIDLTRGNAREIFNDLARNTLTSTSPPINLPQATGPLVRPEGFFGTGRGDLLVRLIIDRDSALVSQRAAQPGTYTFRRSALESWVASQRR